MRLNINLASQPYEAARFYRRRMGALVLALAVLTALLGGYIVYQRAQSRDINKQLAQVRWEIRGLDFEDAQARALLNKPANRDIADQSEFLNQLFARKALSWTRVFTEMEKIVPPNLHVVSMKPEYTKTNDLMLRVVVATDSRDRAVELVRRMEKSSHFRQAQVMAEAVTSNSSDQSAGPGNIQFDIAAIYVPTAQDNDSAADEGKPDEGKPSEKSGNPQAQPELPVKASQAAARNPSQAPGASSTQAQNGPPKSMPARPR
jgi:type IV pilus assembly protein PilN